MLTLAIAAIGCAAISIQFAFGAADGGDSSPIFGVKTPAGYRQWELVAVSHEGGLEELRGILGNPVAMKAYRDRTLPFPDGSMLAKLAWKYVPSSEFEGAYVPGPATTVQIMVKDSKKYAATGGWGFGRFVNGKPVDQAQHETCVPCHQANVKVTTWFSPDWRPEFCEALQIFIARVRMRHLTSGRKEKHHEIVEIDGLNRGSTYGVGWHQLRHLRAGERFELCSCDALPHGDCRWGEYLLSRGRSGERPGGSAAARISDLVTYVQKPDSTPRGSLSRHRA